MDQAAALVKEGSEAFASYTHPYRIYTYSIGPVDVLVVEYGYENLEEYERLWAEWFARPETPAFFEQWFQLVERGGTNEVWDLVE